MSLWHVASVDRRQGWDWRRVLPWEFGRVEGRRAWVCMGGRGILPKYLRVECGPEWLECWLTC